MINTPRIIEAQEATALWIRLLDTLLHSVEVARAAPRGIGTHELIGVTLRLRDGYSPVVNVPERMLSYHFMVAEWVWIALGREDLPSIARYNKNITRYSDDGKTFYGAYGPRWTNQLRYVVDKLRADPDSRQAVMTIWRPNPPGTKDVPCTVSMQYLVRQHQLHAVITMRSSDAWLGIPYDVFNFSMLANIVAGEVGYPLGEVRIQLGSSHMYDTNVDAASDVIDAYGKMPLRSPAVRQLPGQWPLPEAALWWQLAGAGHIATAAEPWFEYLAVLADKIAKDDRLLVGPIGELIKNQRVYARSLRIKADATE